jgi:type II secretory pathway pseudopilin PulG
MQRLLPWWPRDRRQAQSGATLVELLVSVVIMGLALVLIIGTFSTGLLDAALAKRDTAATALVQYELNQISSGGASTPPYSECFATEGPNGQSPPPVLATGGFPGACTSSYTLRVDVTMSPGPTLNTNTWSITVISLSNGAQVGVPVNMIKANR